jgi:hypothetical protein
VLLLVVAAVSCSGTGSYSVGYEYVAAHNATSYHADVSDGVVSLVLRCVLTFDVVSVLCMLNATGYSGE